MLGAQQTVCAGRFSRRPWLENRHSSRGIVQVKIAKLEKKSTDVTTEVIDYIYTNTTRECKLRRLIVAHHGKLNSGHMFQPIQILRGFSEV